MIDQPAPVDGSPSNCLYLDHFQVKKKKKITVQNLQNICSSSFEKVMTLSPLFKDKKRNDLIPYFNQILSTMKESFSSVQLLSRVQLCDPMNHSMPGLPVHHQLPVVNFAETSVFPSQKIYYYEYSAL